jgi:MurNAc alpha-1-phosphate uridylyltransferase
MLTLAILAGGLATRLHPITKTIPKSLINVCGKPFIIRQLEYFSKQGGKKVVLCNGYLGKMIKDLVGTGERYGLEVSYSEDWPLLMGTGGAIKKAIPLLSKNFFVIYGDSYLPINFNTVELSYIKSKKKALMTIQKNENRWDKSNVIFDGQILEYNKKISKPEMSYIDYGLGIFCSSIFDRYPIDKPFDLGDVYFDLSKNRELAGFEVHDRFFEIGSKSGLKEAENYFLIKDTL